MGLTPEQWLGLWLIVAAAVLNTATACLVICGLWASRQHMDGCGGGGRRGCGRRSAGEERWSSADGSAGDLPGAVWPLGVISIHEARRER